MNCLWILLLLSCFGGCGNNGCCSNNNCGCGNNGCCGNDDCGRDRQRGRCRRAVDKAVDECGSERAVARALKDRDRDCDCEPDCKGAPDNNRCDVPGMKPAHWQDFPEVSRPSSNEDCGCEK